MRTSSGKNFAQNVSNCKLNLRVNFHENGSQEKETDTDFIIFWPHSVFALNHHSQNCNYSRTNKANGLKFSGNV